MRKYWRFMPLIVFAVAVLFLSSFAVAQSATAHKATAGQSSVEVNLAACQDQVVLPDIAVAPSTAIISSIQNDPVTQETASATSPPAFAFECTPTKVCAVPKYGLMTYQPRTLVRT